MKYQVLKPVEHLHSNSSGSMSTLHLPTGPSPYSINLHDLCPTKGQDESLPGYQLPFLPQSSSLAVSPLLFTHSEQRQAIALSIEKGEQRLSCHNRKILVTKLRNGSHIVNSGPPWWERLGEWSRHIGRKQNVKLTTET